jgi:transposase
MSRLIEAVRKKIRKMFKELGSIRATSEKIGVSRNAVRRELRGQVKTKNKVRRVFPKESKLDPYKAKIHYLVKEKHLSAVRVFEEIKELGYKGGYSILKDHIRTVRPKRTRGPSAPIDHPPGHEAQMDWSPHRVIATADII